MKKICTGISSIISLKSFANSSIDIIKDVTEKSVTDPVQMLNVFNEHFVKFLDNINITISTTQKSPLTYIGNAIDNSLCLSSVNNLEIEDLIANLNSSKSTGPHNVSINKLKILK